VVGPRVRVGRTRISIESRVDRLARRLAGPDLGISRSHELPAPTIDSAFDALSRAVETRITRRGAIAAAGAVVAASALLRPGRAAADGQCPSGGPNVCRGGYKGAAKVCVPANLQCCSSDLCAYACGRPYYDCIGPATCSFTARMCTDTTADGYIKGNTQFCSRWITVNNDCVDAGTVKSVMGWCCKPTEKCGARIGDCDCDERCNDECCKSGEECVNPGLFQAKQCKPKCRPGWHHDGDVCVCDAGQTCGVTCCKEGSECVGSRCVKPQDPSKAPSLWDRLTGFGDTINQTAASRGNGGHRRALGAVQAQAADPVTAALLELAAVNAQGLAAAATFAVGQIDSGYRHKVVAAKPSVGTIAAGPGLDPQAAAALQALLAAEAGAFALAFATGTALARARGAIRHHDMTSARRQVLAAAGFADGAAKALGGVPALRAAAGAALTSTGATEVIVSDDQLSSLRSAVRSGGVPADLKAALAKLGVTASADLANVKAGLLDTLSPGGPVLIAPLTDPARTSTLKALATELAAFAKAARAHPISRTKGSPRSYRR
jgi:hypothetical protein